MNHDHKEAMRLARREGGHPPALTASHQRIALIKLVRTATGWGLKDSKDFVDTYLADPRGQYTMGSLVGRVLCTDEGWRGRVLRSDTEGYLVLVPMDPRDTSVRSWHGEALVDAVNGPNPYFEVEA